MHVTEIQLRQLADDRLQAEERRDVVRHLLAGCRSCLDVARKVLFSELGSGPDYSGVLRRLELGLVLAINDVGVERGVARALWDGYLSALEPGARSFDARPPPSFWMPDLLEQGSPDASERLLRLSKMGMYLV